MHVTGPSRVRSRAADNELYDRGCDLVEAAMAIRRLCEERDAEGAVPALLGCLESALKELGCAVTDLDQLGDKAKLTGATSQRLHRGLMNLGMALSDAELASAAARGLAGRFAEAAARTT